MGKEPKELRERDLQGLKYLDVLLPMLARLREVGCQRDKAGNRQLHYDEYCLLVLLFLFNPIVRSLRGLQRASQLRNVQRKLGCSRASLGSLSEAVEVFEPTRLEGIIAELIGQLPAKNVGSGHVRQTLTAVDGSVVKTLCSLASAAYLRDKNGKTHCGWRFHTHFDVDRSVPIRMDVTSALNSGKTDEKAQLREHIEADRCYVLDRWFAEFALWNQIVARNSSYVCRVRDNSNLDHVLEDRPLSEAAVQAGVLRDMIVTLGSGKQHPDHPVRVILVRTTPHKKTGGRKGGTAGSPSDGILRIATNMLDVPSEVISDLYRRRWTIELFFRFFKHVLGCRHLLSTQPRGIQIQAYLAIIACLLISLWTGGKPTLRTYEMLCFYLIGWADLEEVTELSSNAPTEHGCHAHHVHLHAAHR
jgi:hypothetical protein